MKPLIWKSHNHKEDFFICPHCNAPLRWIYVDEKWIPCDKEPTLFILHPTGTHRIVYKRQIYENALIYRQGDKRFTGEILQGNIPHYYTCPILKEHRREYASRVMGRF
jgi:hypothetical protein